MIGCLSHVSQPGTESSILPCALTRNRTSVLCRTTPNQATRVRARIGLLQHPSASEKQENAKWISGCKEGCTELDPGIQTPDYTVCSLQRGESGSSFLSSAHVKVVLARRREQRKTSVYKSKSNGTVSVRNFYSCCTWHYF